MSGRVGLGGFWSRFHGGNSNPQPDRRPKVGVPRLQEWADKRLLKCFTIVKWSRALQFEIRGEAFQKLQ